MRAWDPGRVQERGGASRHHHHLVIRAANGAGDLSARAPEAERQKHEQTASDGTHSRTPPAHILFPGR